MARYQLQCMCDAGTLELKDVIRCDKMQAFLTQKKKKGQFHWSRTKDASNPLNSVIFQFFLIHTLVVHFTPVLVINQNHIYLLLGLNDQKHFCVLKKQKQIIFYSIQTSQCIFSVRNKNKFFCFLLTDEYKIVTVFEIVDLLLLLLLHELPEWHTPLHWHQQGPQHGQ